MSNRRVGLVSALGGIAAGALLAGVPLLYAGGSGSTGYTAAQIRAACSVNKVPQTSKWSADFSAMCGAMHKADTARTYQMIAALGKVSQQFEKAEYAKGYHTGYRTGAKRAFNIAWKAAYKAGISDGKHNVVNGYPWLDGEWYVVQVGSGKIGTEYSLTTGQTVQLDPNGKLYDVSSTSYAPSYTPTYGGSSTYSSGYGGNGGGPTLCNDGTISGSSGSGTCSYHGGEAP